MNQTVLDFAKTSGLAAPILEVGSYNVNGTLRLVLPITLGVDMRAGPDVDQVVDATDLEKVFGPESWDNIACADTFEHIEDWRGALRAMWSVLKPGGRLLLTTVNKQKGLHAYPNDYWRFDLADFEAIFAENLQKTEVKGFSVMVIAVKKGPLGDLDNIKLYNINTGKCA